MAAITMSSFGVDKVESYYENMISFKCADIESWCNKNVDNEDFNTAFIAKELIKHYFTSSKTPNRNYYYYISISNNSKYLYHLERDFVLSPMSLTNDISRDSFESALREIETLEKKIRNHSKYCTEDGVYLKWLSGVRARRERIILHRRFRMEKYYKLSPKTKSIAMNILQDYKQDLILRLVILDNIK